MLELRNLCKSFSGLPVVKDVSFSARAGEVTGYLGPNGSGSTTMKIITGLMDADSGEVPFDGKRFDDDLMRYLRGSATFRKSPTSTPT